ncbi:MAG: hypothetical protein HY481_02525 [Candidatus Vogelbacteria bacterium]|nr:hypothetical protein [Candidatus Vogelbacteria bacterium]
MLFFGNEKAKRRAQLLRILKEFPWLWAVKSTWLPGYNRVSVGRATAVILLDDLSLVYPDGCRVWVKCCLGDLQEVREVKKGQFESLAWAAVKTIASGYHIEYVVYPSSLSQDRSEKDFVILRAPSSSETLHRFCCRLVFPSLSKKEVSNDP